ncbi:hypothetical protein NDU88_004978 [Pleurodeles waltl]|uniref:Uncharacterized protein n=1 Tax=Pleurodeles waltl TaxID=8319 RepID=A0AAV7VII8_PLEWA|nr:hypothetical protein NDU88_004978 [Pleurodeles waltl]
MTVNLDKGGSLSRKYQKRIDSVGKVPKELTHFLFLTGAANAVAKTEEGCEIQKPTTTTKIKAKRSAKNATKSKISSKKRSAEKGELRIHN